ncbi:hypothetical protein C9374_000998 [Naegleria lovaniensis]|uniref:Uncharacterized protein n=1 Tax=Naegleria lovaniensis TaxID=51637 RepID=A0AA88GAA5_NAELO|nr:uncharacterized protein C9374_014719 [Naegleria lovaniensis]XP_044552140.1 uncharacterized protein C9374_000998 [Naegleria lovaniensis]KAG2370635.1 hypothetical protein C9374_014719 [Naegleria lovaniensis]KAG2388148.1 hypothetical protein C9374_000998 [Naegleria lovaniensis]
MASVLKGLMGVSDKKKTFKKNIDCDNKLNERMKQAMQQSTSSLGVAGLENTVKLPPGEKKNEWLAVHVVDFVNGINILYGSLEEYCTASTCPKMSAGENFEYLWMNADDPKYDKPTVVSAKDYVSLLMEWVESMLNNEQIFPTDASQDFPKDFSKIVKNIFKRLFRVYAHIYAHHLEQIKILGEEAHLNTAFKHFMYFTFEFDLISAAELEPMAEVIVSLMGEKFKAKLKK